MLGRGAANFSCTCAGFGGVSEGNPGLPGGKTLLHCSLDRAFVNAVWSGGLYRYNFIFVNKPYRDAIVRAHTHKIRLLIHLGKTAV